MLNRFGIDKLRTDSIVLIEDDRAYLHSTAALRIARKLNGLWPAFYAFIIVPRPLRDRAYKLFAKYRYKLFGRQDACMIPTPDVRARFMS
jgi:predicted DCC family thiol-disulfide oxidoreductase YuxK